MEFLSKRRLLLVGALAGYMALMLGLTIHVGQAQQQGAAPQFAPQQAFSRPTTSSPIALSADDALLLAVNPDDDTISIISTATSQLATSNLRVGDEPQAVAIDPASGFAFVANAASNTVSVVDIDTPAVQATVVQTLLTGAEPWSVVVSPDGKRVFVANSAQDTITVIRNDVTPKTIIGDIDLRGSTCNVGGVSGEPRHFQPRGLAVSQLNDRLYVARTFSFTKTGGRQADDQGKEGVVCRIAINTASTSIAGYSVTGPVTLAPRDTGFTIDSSIPPDGVADPTFAYPNQLQSIVLRGNEAYLPNIAASPSGPLRFNVDTQSFVNVIDNASTGVPTDSAKTINMHLGARTPETGKPKLFFANPWAIAFTTQTGPGVAYAVSSGSDLLVKLNVDATGTLSFTGGAATTRYIDLNDPANPATSGDKAGKNPLGIAINSTGTRAFVFNYISRNISVVDTTLDAVIATIKTSELPPANTLDETLQIGKEVFFSSRGHFNGGKSERLSSEGWQNCASCHFAGLTDANVWQFNAGPRKSVPLNSTWDPRNPFDQRILNYSAIFDEVQDFELNIRNISGPGFLNPPTNTVLDPNHGLLISDTGDINAAPALVNAFVLPNSGRPQLTITLPGTGRAAVPALDAMKEWVRFNVRTPNGPIPGDFLSGRAASGPTISDIRDGRLIFERMGCNTCHGGGKWTKSTKDFTSPPSLTDLFTETVPPPPTGTVVVGAQFLDRFLEDIGSFNLNVAGQGNTIPTQPEIGGIEKATGGVADALGKDHNGDGKGDGYNVPSMLGIYASPPFYHNGACETLECVVNNVEHRTSGLRTGRTDLLLNATNRQRLVTFIESIDVATQPPINLSIRDHDIASDPQRLFVGTPVTLTANIKLFGPKLVALPDGPISVAFFNGDPRAAGASQIGTAQQISSFPEDNGFVTVSVPFTPPSSPGRVRIFVQVDTTDVLAEASENDNLSGRTLVVRALPADRTRPVVSNVQINNDDVATTSREVTVSFDASDPAGPGAEQVSGVKEGCVTPYRFNPITRQWEPVQCVFQALSGNSPFSLTTTLPVNDGAVYALVVVRDAAGNISRAAFDFINLAPAGQIELNNREKRIFRIKLNAGESLTFTATPSAPGDIDATAFLSGTRVAASAQIGSVAEILTLNSTADNSVFHVEVEAFAPDTSFSLSFGAILATQSIGIAQSDINADGRPLSIEALSSSPPALNAAFEATSAGTTLNLPLVLRN